MDTPNVLRNIANELPPIYFLLFFFSRAIYFTRSNSRGSQRAT